jgi:hypothetical protein
MVPGVTPVIVGEYLSHDQVDIDRGIQSGQTLVINAEQAQLVC